jgi:Trypsin-like serine proteases, typically periplasmic, contain C-terminal PDZ domain
MVTQVAEDAPAARSGLKEGDVLLQVGKKKISDPEDVFDASFYITAGDAVPITVMRGDQKILSKYKRQCIQPPRPVCCSLRPAQSLG